MWVRTRVSFWLVLSLFLLMGCGAVGNHARINVLQDEFESTEFPYDVVLDEENVVIAGPNLEMTDTN